MSLTWVATYRRSVAASLERAWENVLDWEHLPVLHASAFRSIECEEAGDWGWRASVGLPAAGAAGAAAPHIRIALTREDPGDRYVVRTLEGPGTGTEIWTRLQEIEDHETGVEVRFGVPDVMPDQADAVGRGFVDLYTRLWDEDEGMMVERERALARLRAPRGGDVLDLGALDALRGAGPLEVEARGRVYRVEETDGGWLAWPSTCPHRLGPLERQGDELRCPWHGYRFRLSEGKSCDGRGLALPRAPRVEASESGRLLLRWDRPR